jgi:hypothetical protein
MILEILLEEPSMENFLREVLPKILPPAYVLDNNCFLRPHNGKSDLKKSIPNKIKVFSNYYELAKVIIIHDQDSNDCKKLKKSIVDLCKKNGNCPVLVRIACKELESWYLGDMDAIEKVYPKFRAKTFKKSAKFRNPDTLQASQELKILIPEFQKGFASKNISKFISVEKNSSPSFLQLITGISKFLEP